MKLKFGILLVLACAVGLALLFQGSRADPGVAADDSQTQWLCKACSHNFLLTARQVAQRADRDPQHWAPLDCPECRQKQAYLALVCSKCQTIYFGRDVPGQTGKCPTCVPGWRLAAAEADRSSTETAARRGPGATRPKPMAKVR